MAGYEFYNALFDTVIQRKNYNNLLYYNTNDHKKNPEEARQKTDLMFVTYYTGILRWQMLVTGKVILTDSMWYDSLYFKKLMHREGKKTDGCQDDLTFPGLIDFVRKCKECGYTPLEVRVRKKHIQMFFKEFYFSSIDDPFLRNALLKKGNRFKCPDNKKMEKDLTAYKKALKKIKSSKGVAKENVASFFNDIQTLGEGLKEISEIEYSEGNWPSLGGKNPISEAFQELRNSFETQYEIQLGENIEYFEIIREELKKDKPRRSVIEDTLEKMKVEWWAPIIKDFFDFFEEKYNRAISEAQQLSYLENRKIFENALFPESRESSPKDFEPVICSAMRFLGEMTWDNFRRMYVQALKNREDKILAALRKPDYVLLEAESGGMEIDGRSLYDIIFGDKVIFFSLENRQRLFIPERFRDKIKCEEGSLEYDRCFLFSNKENPSVASYFTDQFDVDAAKALLCPVNQNADF